MVIGILIVIAAFYLFSLAGRKDHPLLADLRKYHYAHRGLHDDQRPENSLAAFRAAVDAGFGSELDVHLLKDGELAVVHDSDLTRMTGISKQITELGKEDLKGYSLAGTTETIPLFSDVLKVFSGKTPLIVELKVDGNNYAELCEKVSKMMSTYEGLYCVESFDPRVVSWYREHEPDVVRGQLSENYFKSGSKGNKLVLAACAWLMSNIITRPDFIAYKFADRKNLSCFLCRKLFGIAGVSWTIRTPEDFSTAVRENWIPIFENFTP